MTEALSAYERRLDSPAVYAQRPHPLSREVEFEIRDDALVWQDTAGRSGALPFRDIRALRLSYDPARLMSPRHVLDVLGSDGQKLRITSNTYRGMAQWRPRNRAFRRFVEELHRQLALARPDVDAQTGRGLPGYFAHTAVWAAVVVGLAVVTALALEARQLTAAALIGAMAAWFAVVGWKTARLNRPRPYRVDAVPPALLPEPSEADV